MSDEGYRIKQIPFIFFLKGIESMNKYRYEGPVTEFGLCICNRWIGETAASSEAKARSNLAYQFKKQTNRAGYAKIGLPGDLYLIEEDL